MFSRKPKETTPKRLSNDEIQGIFDRITYIPGTRWHFIPEGVVVYEDPEVRGPVLLVESPIVSMVTGDESTLASWRPDPIIRTEKDIVDALRSLCEGAALHEVHEYFKLDGKCVIDPHTERR